MNRIDAFLELVVQQGGSDLHLVAGQPPRIRLNGELQPVRFRELSPGDIAGLIADIMTPELAARLEAEWAIDFAYQSETCGRFRANVYRHTGGVAAALRVVSSQIPSLESLGLPSVVQQTLAIPKGLVLVTGPTGSGKSTTLAAMVDHLNGTLRGHVITIEDPIEYVHENRQCVITQREIGAHAPNFAEALRSGVREDPDAILVGEMRDLETISLALTAAETGIQVLGTLHTSGAVRCVDRMVNVFPAKRQEQVRTMLADCLRLVVSQQLVRRADGKGRVAAAEIMLNNSGIANLIREGKTDQMQNAIQTGGLQGMQSLDAALRKLLDAKIISGKEAYMKAIVKKDFERFLGSRAA